MRMNLRCKRRTRHSSIVLLGLLLAHSDNNGSSYPTVAHAAKVPDNTNDYHDKGPNNILLRRRRKPEPQPTNIFLNQNRPLRELPVMQCRITVVDTAIYDESAAVNTQSNPHHYRSDLEETACIPIQNGKEKDILLKVRLPEIISNEYNRDIQRGQLFVSISGGSIIDDISIKLGKNAKVKVIDKSKIKGQQRRDLGCYNGQTQTLTLLVIRVSTIDKEPKFSKSEIERGYFGNGLHNDGITMASQYRSISFGKLNIISAGVVDVKVQKSISHFNDNTNGVSLVSAAHKAMHKEYDVEDLSNEADMVAMCLPSGTGNWAASAGINHYRSQYNDEWCLSLSGTMHEIGHNLGLHHSNTQGEAYQDYSGYMAAGYKDANWPRKAFNGHKNWLLGWYSSRHLSLSLENLKTAGPQLFKLATFVDFDKTHQDEYVVVSVAETFFLQYNIAKGFNANVEEERDKVTVIEADEETGESDRQKGLSTGDFFIKTNFYQSGRVLVVEACESWVGSDEEPDIMIMSIGLDKSACGKEGLITKIEPPIKSSIIEPPTYSPTKFPSRAPTNSPTASRWQLAEASIVLTSPTVSPTKQMTYYYEKRIQFEDVKSKTHTLVKGAR